MSGELYNEYYVTAVFFAGMLLSGLLALYLSDPSLAPLPDSADTACIDLAALTPPMPTLIQTFLLSNTVDDATKNGRALIGQLSLHTTAEALLQLSNVTRTYLGAPCSADAPASRALYYLLIHAYLIPLAHRQAVLFSALNSSSIQHRIAAAIALDTFRQNDAVAIVNAETERLLREYAQLKLHVHVNDADDDALTRLLSPLEWTLAIRSLLTVDSAAGDWTWVMQVLRSAYALHNDTTAVHFCGHRHNLIAATFKHNRHRVSRSNLTTILQSVGGTESDVDTIIPDLFVDLTTHWSALDGAPISPVKSIERACHNVTSLSGGKRLRASLYDVPTIAEFDTNTPTRSYHVVTAPASTLSDLR